jgi:hypothetical protein
MIDGAFCCDKRFLSRSVTAEYVACIEAQVYQAGYSFRNFRNENSYHLAHAKHFDLHCIRCYSHGSQACFVVIA